VYDWYVRAGLADIYDAFLWRAEKKERVKKGGEGGNNLRREDECTRIMAREMEKGEWR